MAQKKLLQKKKFCRPTDPVFFCHVTRNRGTFFFGLKDNGGLMFPSEDIVTIVVTCDTLFKRYVREVNGINASRSLEAQLTNAAKKPD